MTETLAVGGLVYQVRRSPRRRTMGITIDRDGSIQMEVPEICPPADLERFGKKKSLWVHTKLAERALLGRPIRPKEFVSGEALYYLGRTCRLLVTRETAPIVALRLHEGRFRLRRDSVPEARKHFADWYTTHLQVWVEPRVSRLADRVGIKCPLVKVRDLGFRWGSCGKVTVNFHWNAACLHPGLIEYLIVHELVHFIEPHHDKRFWSRIERILPDFRARRQRLAEEGGRYALLG